MALFFLSSLDWFAAARRAYVAMAFLHNFLGDQASDVTPWFPSDAVVGGLPRTVALSPRHLSSFRGMEKAFGAHEKGSPNDTPSTILLVRDAEHSPLALSMRVQASVNAYAAFWVLFERCFGRLFLPGL